MELHKSLKKRHFFGGQRSKAKTAKTDHRANVSLICEKTSPDKIIDENRRIEVRVTIRIESRTRTSKSKRIEREAQTASTAKIARSKCCSSEDSSCEDREVESIIGHGRLSSNKHRYNVLEPLGSGTFGRVVKCETEESENDVVAVKIMKKNKRDTLMGQNEIYFLSKLNRDKSNRFWFVQMLEYFQHMKHTCLVLELLDRSLLDVLRRHGFRGISVKSIKMILLQLLPALLKMKQMGIVHTDLKPENVLVVDSVRKPFRVKIIDFGNACHSCDARPTDRIQSRYYRAPEILLHLPFDEAIDMWSLGCVAAELFLGTPLYPGSCNYSQIGHICRTQGIPTARMLLDSPRSARFFHRYTASLRSSWRIKTREEYEAATGLKTSETRSHRALDSLDDLATFRLPSDLEDYRLLNEKADREEFAELVGLMLTVDPERRIKPEQAIHHRFASIPDDLENISYSPRPFRKTQKRTFPEQS